MTIRTLAYIECDHCRNHYERVASVKGIHQADILDETHALVVSAEEDDWQCRKNATEHFCPRCLEPWK